MRNVENRRPENKTECTLIYSKIPMPSFLYILTVVCFPSLMFWLKQLCFVLIVPPKQEHKSCSSQKPEAWRLAPPRHDDE